MHDVQINLETIWNTLINGWRQPPTLDCACLPTSPSVRPPAWTFVQHWFVYCHWFYSQFIWYVADRATFASRVSIDAVHVLCMNIYTCRWIRSASEPIANYKLTVVLLTRSRINSILRSTIASRLATFERIEIIIKRSNLWTAQRRENKKNSPDQSDKEQTSATAIESGSFLFFLRREDNE